MCFPYVGEGGAIMNTEKELHAFSHARISFSLPYLRLGCCISLFHLPFFKLSLLGSPHSVRISPSTDLELEQLQHYRL